MTVNLKQTIRSVPDFPKKGIVFRDITTLLKDREAFASAVNTILEHFQGMQIDKVVGIESRGFILGATLAYKLGAGFVPVRKPNKLPAQKIRQEYSLEYGTDAVEMHKDAVGPGDRILIHDDLLATGGTALAACRLVEQAGGKILGLSFLVELSFLGGRGKLGMYHIHSVINYDSE